MSDPLPRPGDAFDQVRVIRRLLRDPIPTLEALPPECQRACTLGWGPMRLAVIGDPALIAELHAMPVDRFRWGHKFNVLGFVVGSESMIVSDGDDHRRRRRAVTPGFARRRLDAWIPMMVEEADGAVERALVASASTQPVDLYPILRRLALGVVVRALFGERMAARVDEIGALFERPQAYLESPAVRQIPHPLPRTRRARVRADREALRAIIDEEIAHDREVPGAEANVLADLVASGELTDSEIRDQVVTSIGAGYDSTAASLAWTVWCATTAGVWDDLAAEASSAFAGESDGTLPTRLGLSERVMHETLRLHPAGAFAPREAAQDIVLDGRRIPKGTLIMWSPHLAGRDPLTWSDPDRFDPDRFLDRPRTAPGWVPFGGGPRACIGFALAQLEITVAIARLAQRLELRPMADEPPPAVGMVVNRPRGGVPMTVGSRSATSPSAGLP